MGVVLTAYGRPGPHVVAEAGDYTAGLIENDSAVEGASVAEAHDYLAAELLQRATLAQDLGGSAEAPRVVKVHGRNVLDVEPNDGDRLTWVAANQQWEPRPPTPPATLWNEIYDIDLTAQGSQTLVTPSGGALETTFELDGRTWWAKRFTENGGFPSGVTISEAGLAVTCGATNQGNIGQSGLPATAFAMAPLSSMPGYDPASTTCVLLHLAANAQLLSSFYRHIAVLHTGTVAYSGGGFGVFRNSNVLRWSGTAFTPASLAAGREPADVATTDYVVGVMRSPTRLAGVYLPWPGAFPYVEDMWPGLDVFVHGSVPPVLTSLGTHVGICCNGGGSGSVTATVKRMKVFQR